MRNKAEAFQTSSKLIVKGALLSRYLIALVMAHSPLGLSFVPQSLDKGNPTVAASLNLVVMIGVRFDRPQQAAGIVFAVDSGYAYIVTAYHVVKDMNNRIANEVEVRFRSNRDESVPAEVVGVDSMKMFGVIRTKAPDTRFKFDQVGNVQALSQGSLTYSIGHPEGLDWELSPSPAAISHLNSERIEVKTSDVRPGYSGGALLDERGRIIGMLDLNSGLSAFAFRIDYASNILRLDFKRKVQLSMPGVLPRATTCERTDQLEGGLCPGESRYNPADGQTYRWIPPGRFRMGCSENPPRNDCGDDERPAHEVVITKGFWLGQTEVTQEAIARVRKVDASSATQPDLPADSVSWEEAQAFCHAAGGLRLPTEAEWEYAARAGQGSAGYDLDTVAWYRTNSNRHSSEVGRKPANTWNVRDMLGNLSEWTSDWYDPSFYQSSPLTDPRGPEHGGKARVARGGSWSNEARDVRVSVRLPDVPADRLPTVGFRCAGDLPASAFDTARQRSASVNLQPGQARVNHKDGLIYRWIPPGGFRMGCSEEPRDVSCRDAEELPTHDVIITSGFFIGETEVPQWAYERLTGKPNPSRVKADNLPVDSVTWDEAQGYCRAAGRLQLPTEAQWEYSVRSDTRIPRYGELDAIAWYRVNSGMQSHPVGLKAANPWHLKDMLGNLWEWTQDWYQDDYYRVSPDKDPRGPLENGETRVLRGGSWYESAEFVRASMRFSADPSERQDSVGFRCVGQIP